VSDFALARYNPDGNLDTSFGSGGKVTTDFGPLFAEGAGDVAIQNDDKLVAAGGTGLNGADFALARYKPDGTLDPSFGSGGKVTTDFGASDMAGGVAVQTDGKIVAAGSNFFTTGGDFALARYQGQGALAVSIDIKPGSSTNPINLSSKGVPVAILTSDSFDATTVDPTTVCFGDDDNPVQRNCTEAHHRAHIEDVNGDGRPDALLHYEISRTGIDQGDRSACLTGTTFTGADIAGCDAIETLK
jgi:uncharacterized delta-60 repeat protein